MRRFWIGGAALALVLGVATIGYAMPGGDRRAAGSRESEVISPENPGGGEHVRQPPLHENPGGPPKEVIAPGEEVRERVHERNEARRDERRKEQDRIAIRAKLLEALKGSLKEFPRTIYGEGGKREVNRGDCNDDKASGHIGDCYTDPSTVEAIKVQFESGMTKASTAYAEESMLKARTGKESGLRAARRCFGQTFSEQFQVPVSDAVKDAKDRIGTSLESFAREAEETYKEDAEYVRDLVKRTEEAVYVKASEGDSATALAAEAGADANGMLATSVHTAPADLGGKLEVSVDWSYMEADFGPGDDLRLKDADLKLQMDTRVYAHFGTDVAHQGKGAGDLGRESRIKRLFTEAGGASETEAADWSWDRNSPLEATFRFKKARRVGEQDEEVKVLCELTGESAGFVKFIDAAARKDRRDGCDVRKKALLEALLAYFGKAGQGWTPDGIRDALKAAWKRLCAEMCDLEGDGDGREGGGDHGGGNGGAGSGCNQGIGNGPEGCDPGDSNHHHDSNDEDGDPRGGGNGGDGGGGGGGDEPLPT